MLLDGRAAGSFHAQPAEKHAPSCREAPRTHARRRYASTTRLCRRTVMSLILPKAAQPRNRVLPPGEIEGTPHSRQREGRHSPREKRAAHAAKSPRKFYSPETKSRVRCSLCSRPLPPAAPRYARVPLIHEGEFLKYARDASVSPRGTNRNCGTPAAVMFRWRAEAREAREAAPAPSPPAQVSTVEGQRTPTRRHHAAQAEAPLTAFRGIGPLLSLRRHVFI